jgi:hypothetical protein
VGRHDPLRGGIGLLRLGSIALLVAACASAAVAPTSAPLASSAPTGGPASGPATASVRGSGVISFGHDYDPGSLRIIDGAATFRTTEPEIAWRADFAETAQAASVEFVLLSVAAGGAETVLERVDVAMASPDLQLLANRADLATLVKHRAGTYRLRYVRDGTVLAQGTFKLVK